MARRPKITSTKTVSRQQALLVIRKVLPYLWPDDHSGTRTRVVIALAMLLLSRIISVATPFYYKAAVDALAPENPASSTVFLLTAGAVGLTIAYGVARLMSVGFTQLRDAIFAKVGQRALRKLALETF